MNFKWETFWWKKKADVTRTRREQNKRTRAKALRRQQRETRRKNRRN